MPNELIRQAPRKSEPATPYGEPLVREYTERKHRSSEVERARCWGKIWTARGGGSLEDCPRLAVLKVDGRPYCRKCDPNRSFNLSQPAEPPLSKSAVMGLDDHF
jgi:hypothetical protein